MPKRFFDDEPTTYDDDGLGGWQSVGSVQKPRDPNKAKKKEERKRNQQNNNNNNNSGNTASQTVQANTHTERGEGFKISFEQDFQKGKGNKAPSKSKITRQKLKNKRVKKTKPVVPMNVKLTEESIKKTIAEAIERYPNTPQQQLLYVADTFEEALCNQRNFDAKVSLTDELNNYEGDDLNSFFGDLIDKPLFVMVTEPVRKAVGAFFSRFAKEDLCYFFWFIFHQLAEASSGRKNAMQTNGNGFLSILQLLIHKQPLAIFRDVNFEKEISSFLISLQNNDEDDHQNSFNNQNNYYESYQILQKIPPISHLIVKNYFSIFLWIFSQLIPKHPSLSLSLWYQYILPHLFYPSYSSFHRSCLVYINYLLEFSSGEIVHPKNETFIVGFDRLIILNFSLRLLDHPIHDQVNTVFEKLKRATIFSQPQSNSRNYFEMLLSHAAIVGDKQDEEALREEVCLLLTRSLENDHECFIRWEQIYPRFIIQSNNLLLYILLHWKKFNLFLRSDMIVNTANAFIGINKKLLAGTYKIKVPRGVREIKIQKQSILQCTVTCKALIKEANKSTAATIFNFIIIASLLTFAVYFIYNRYLLAQLDTK